MSEIAERLLTLSHAARLLGTSRRTLQKVIAAGELITFEGMLKMSDLKARFPEVVLEDSTTLERMKRIKEAALYKATHQAREKEVLPSPAVLIKELDEMRAYTDQLEEQLAAAQKASHHQVHIIVALQGKLDHIIKNCDQRQRVMLSAVNQWLSKEIGEYKG